MIDPLQQSTFRIAEILVEPSRHLLSGAHGEVKLEPKVMSVLVCLARRSQTVVSREDLVTEVWSGAAVSDETLTMAVSKLRRALGDDPRSPRIIETISKGGYRLMLPVEPAASAADRPRPSSGKGRRFLAAVLLPSLAGAVLLLGIAKTLRQEPASRSGDPALLQSQPLTSLPGRETQPAVSAEGGTVAFVHQTLDGSSDLFIVHRESEGVLQLTEDRAIELSPVWSPNDREIAYARVEKGHCEILRRAIEGGAVRRLVDCGDAPSPELTWSPDGRWLAYPDRVGPDRGVGIVRFSLETDEKVVVTDPSAGIEDSRPAFSPDGERLAFVRREASGIASLRVVTSAGESERSIVEGAEHLWGHAWSSDGREIVYSFLVGETFALWRVGVDGGSPPRWLPIPGVQIARDPHIARRAEMLVFESWVYDVNLLRVDLTVPGSDPLEILPSTAWDSAPQISPDGTRLAFLSSRSGRGALWVSDLDGSQPERLAQGLRTIDTVPRWSPDGRYLAVVSTDKNATTAISLVEVTTGTVRSAGEQTAGGRAPSWSAEGRSLYFAAARQGSWQVFKIDPDLGEASQVTRDGGFAALESEDGAWLYFSKRAEPGLFRQPVAGGPVERLVDDLLPSDWGNWFLDGEAVVYPRVRGEETVLVRMEPASGKVSTIARVQGRILNPGIALSADGSQLFFARLENSESDLRWVRSFR